MLLELNKILNNYKRRLLMDFKTVNKLELDNDVVVTFSSNGNKNYIDVRKHYKKDGKLIPTQKGITLEAEEFKEIMNSALDEIDSVFEEL
jgi:hypothetical protein